MPVKATDTRQTERLGLALTAAAFERLNLAFREQAVSDFGIDAHAELIQGEEATGRLLAIQVKSGPSYLADADSDRIVFRMHRKHAEYWLNHSLPVVVCLCDTERALVYWQSVTMETVISTGDGFKLTIPITQTVAETSRALLHQLLSPVIATERFNVIKLQDLSHARAKRYSAEVILNGLASKADVAAIVRRLTSDIAKRRYYRSDMGKQRWGDADAHVVWTSVYPSVEDHVRGNAVCRSMWISPELDIESRPSPLEGENVGDGVIVEWEKSYEWLARYAADNTLAKEDYFEAVNPLAGELRNLHQRLDGPIQAVVSEQLSESEFLGAHDRFLFRIEEIQRVVSDLGFAPIECQAVEEKLNELIAHLHNVTLFCSEQGRKQWERSSRFAMMRQSMARAATAAAHLTYELERKL